MFFISIIEIQDFIVSRDFFNEKTIHTWSLQFRFSSSYFHNEFYKLIFTIFYLNINLRKYNLGRSHDPELHLLYN